MEPVLVLVPELVLEMVLVLALVLVPVVLVYQGWSYWVFRHRITGKDLQAH